MKFITLFTGEDQKSYFKEVDAGFEKMHPSRKLFQEVSGKRDEIS